MIEEGKTPFGQADPLRMSIYASLLCALTAAGAYLAIPIGPVPIVLANLFIILAGLLLGPRWGLASVALYLFLGALGLPVFAGGAGGIGHFAGPTGGYLLGYLPAVFVVGLISRQPHTDAEGMQGHVVLGKDIIAATAGSLIVYACGLPWLMAVTKMTLSGAVAAGMLPFLPGDGLKIAAAVVVVRYARPLIFRARAAGPRSAG